MSLTHSYPCKGHWSAQILKIPKQIEDMLKILAPNNFHRTLALGIFLYRGRHNFTVCRRLAHEKTKTMVILIECDLWGVHIERVEKTSAWPLWPGRLPSGRFVRRKSVFPTQKSILIKIKFRQYY